MDYEKDININPDALDVEWLNQPSLMLKYCKALAEERKRSDLLKEKVDVARAELDKDIRTNPDKFDIEKITETAVQNTIITQGAYKEAFNIYIDSKYRVEICTAAVRAMDQRKDSLEQLVKLFGQQYFAGPSVPRDLSKEWEQNKHQERANTAVGSMTRRRS